MWAVFDETGYEWPDAHRSLAGAHDFPHGQLDIVDYTIRNIGYVAWRERGNFAEVKFRPHVVSPVAVIATIQWLLASSHISRVAITVFDRAWATRIFPTKLTAIHSLFPLCDRVSGQPARHFRSRRVAATSLSHDSPLKEVLARWSACPTLPRDLDSWAPPCQQKRLIVLEQSASASSKLVFRHVGEGISIFPARWRAIADGLPADYQPDGHYGSWVVGGYEDALKSNTPILEEVDAMIDVGGETRQRSRYRRLLLPVTTWNGASGVLGTSVVDPNIDLTA